MALYKGRTLDEIRRDFISNRFAETGCFGMSDIEDWLASQRQAGKNPDMEVWPGFFRRVLAKDVRIEVVSLATVWQYANPLPEVPTDNEDEVMAKWLGNIKPMLDLLHQSGAKIYYGHRDVIYVTQGHSSKRSTFAIYRGRINSADELRVQETIYWAHLEMLLMTWKRGQKGWKKSRDILCDHLSNTIARERTRAIDDFNSAVAISADGEKIISSPWIVVRGKDEEPDRLFAAADFAGNPFLRDERIPGENTVDVYCPGGEATEEFMLSIMPDVTKKMSFFPGFDWQGPGKQRRVSIWREIGMNAKRSLTEIFITSSQPPDGMPEGGAPLDPSIKL